MNNRLTRTKRSPAEAKAQKRDVWKLFATHIAFRSVGLYLLLHGDLKGDLGAQALFILGGALCVGPLSRILNWLSARWL